MSFNQLHSTDVWEEYVTSIFRVEKEAEQETSVNAGASRVKVRVTLRPTVSQPVGLGAEPHEVYMTRI
jgi:hypothetical protein